MEVVVIIPAYRPVEVLITVVEKLKCWAFRRILIVDDGSGPAYRPVFEQCAAQEGVTVLAHAVNLGKGAALKTAMNHALCSYPGLVGAVTADADGQHDPEDIAAVASQLESHPGSLILGSRRFGRQVPFRSRFGNLVTRHAVRLLIGHHISDTQTGLRGIPASLLPELLRIRSNGYEFELDVLIACKHRGVDVREYPVRTIYEEGNLSSHFNPLLDSMRIYFVLLRFSGLSLLTAVLDNLIFLSIFGVTGSIVVSQAVARAVALGFNYTAARKAVFLSRERHQVLFPRYLALVISSGAVSYGLIHLLSQQAGLSVPWAKILAETALFIANFAIQRDLIFTSKRGNREGVGAPPPTDWDAYYQSVPPTAKLTRKYTESALIGAFRKCCGEDAQNLEIVEFGGANSCFLEGILKELRPRRYHVIDSNRYGLDLLRRRLTGDGVVTMECADVLESPASKTADVAFSVGLIEHFDAEGTRQAVGAHFQAVKPGGHLVITFPTPTWLYRVSRFLTEAAGQWKFPDERPILREEVAKIIWQERGVILFERTLWPLVFTQHLMVIQAPAQASAKSA